MHRAGRGARRDRRGFGYFADERMARAERPAWRFTKMSYPAWKDMPAEQKCQFLHEWCENLTRKVENQEMTIQALHARLLAVEGKVAVAETW